MTAQDEAEVRRVIILYAKIENELQGTPELTKLKDELHLFQPFIGSLIMDYEEDFPDDADLIWKLYLLIWMYYRDNDLARIGLITSSLYISKEDKLVETLDIPVPADQETRQKMTQDYIQRQHSKGLIIFLFYLFMENPVLERLDKATGRALLIGYKATIESFDEIIKSGHLYLS